jgi:hypothetical protein
MTMEWCKENWWWLGPVVVGALSGLASGLSVKAILQRGAAALVEVLVGTFKKVEEAKKRKGTIGKAAEMLVDELKTVTQEMSVPAQNATQAINAEVDEKKKPVRQLLGWGMRRLLRRVAP